MDAINHGLDIEMPNALYLSPQNIVQGLRNKSLSMARIDDSCRRILRSYFAVPKPMRVPGPCGGGDCINNNGEHFRLCAA